MFEAPEKHSLGHLRAVKQLKTVALDIEEVRELILRPQSIQLHISRIFHISKQALFHLKKSISAAKNGTFR